MRRGGALGASPLAHTSFSGHASVRDLTCPLLSAAGCSVLDALPGSGVDLFGRQEDAHGGVAPPAALTERLTAAMVALSGRSTTTITSSSPNTK